MDLAPDVTPEDIAVFLDQVLDPWASLLKIKITRVNRILYRFYLLLLSLEQFLGLGCLH